MLISVPANMADLSSCGCHVGNLITVAQRSSYSPDLGRDYQLRSNLCNYAFHHTLKDPDFHVLKCGCQSQKHIQQTPSSQIDRDYLLCGTHTHTHTHAHTHMYTHTHTHPHIHTHTHTHTHNIHKTLTNTMNLPCSQTVASKCWRRQILYHLC